MISLSSPPRLSTLQRVAGAASGGGTGPGKQAMDSLLDEDFDPEAWDKQMAEAFDDDYYEVCVCVGGGGAVRGERAETPTWCECFSWASGRPNAGGVW